MTSESIRAIQAKIGTTVDGIWGRKSIAACQAHLQRLMDASPNKWPDTDQASLQKFYGSVGDVNQLVALDVSGLGLRYDGTAVTKVRCHHKVAESLHRVLASIAATHPGIVAEYAGVFNNRPMRGGTTPSLHARGAAIDLAPDSNGNRTHWPLAAFMPFEVMEAFAREGWLAAGAFWGRDAMHFQATR